MYWLILIKLACEHVARLSKVVNHMTPDENHAER